MARVVIANSIGVDSRGNYIIHSPSRWSSGVRKENHFSYYPWELAYLSSLLKRDTYHEIKFLDANLNQWNWRRLAKEVSELAPDYLVMEPSTRTIEDDMRCIKEVKKNTGARIILVGQHASVFPERLREEGVDFIIQGEYEIAVLKLLQGNDPSDIPGLYPNPPGELLDLNFLPFPEDEDVKRIQYAVPGEPSSEYLEIQAYASRGCWRSCSFCVSRHIYYRKPCWRKRKVESVIREITYLMDKYPRMQGIFFDEECHNGEKGFIKELCKEIIRNHLHHLHYEAMCDAGFLDEEILELMREAGYYQIRMGIESGSERVLRNINKRVNLAHVERILRKAKELDFLTYGTFIVGGPDSSEEEDLKTLKLIEHLLGEGLLDKLQVSILIPFPGTPFYKWAEEKAYLLPLPPDLYDGETSPVISYPDYSREEILKMKERIIRVRDRILLFRRIKEGEFISWTGKVLAKHGLVKGILKGTRRLLHLLPP